ncbi:RMD1 family protein [Teredinibacter waterburyi]|uniref:RMD1 family protein n=1 Tax=Teredinibacter waterburyi TaxID=1500538 RepID=UPI00165FBD16|nr:RMD1 family protein [Teredinibacter waterburyi]
MKVFAYCLAKQFDTNPLSEYLHRNHNGIRYKDAWWVEKLEANFALFDYGVVVVWQTTETPFDRKFTWLQDFCIDSLEQFELDTFSYEPDSKIFRIHKDLIQLAEPSALSCLALSHALAQSCKLATFELSARDIIERCASVTDQIMQYGTTKMSAKQVAKLRGTLFKSKTDILLKFDLLDTPEFFWEYPEVEDYYTKMISYLDVPQRLRLIQQKLDTLNDLMAMLGDEQKHRHSSFLEWIIIWLIAIEIGIFFGHDFFKLF